MTEIRVTTTVEIRDSQGQRILTVAKTETANPGDNPRYFATETHKAIRATEHALAKMITAEYGDTPQ